MALKQKITLQVHDSLTEGGLILEVKNLRIDFDIRQIPNFNKAKVTVYNLNNETVTSLMSGERYVTIKVQLHEGKEHTLIHRYYINNAVDELILPNRITSLFCFSSELPEHLQKPISIVVASPSIKSCIKHCAAAAGFSGEIKYLSFPEGQVDQVFKRVHRSFNRTFLDALRSLSKEYNFNFYIKDGDLIIMYKPDLDNVDLTDLGIRESIILDTNAMRSNPKVGMATAVIDSILDPTIYPSTVVDLSELITVGVSEPEESLELVEGYLKNFSSYNKYQAFTVQHKGSNYSADWNTVINALSPTKGKLAPTVAWANIDKD